MKTIIKKTGNYYLYNSKEKENFLFFVQYIALNDDAYYNYNAIEKKDLPNFYSLRKIVGLCNSRW